MGTVTDRAKALQERAEEDFAESWRPDQDGPKQLTGEVVRYTTAQTAYGQKAICVLRDTDGKEWSVWLLQAALVAAFTRERPQLGELLLIDYEGQKKSERSGRRYHAFKLLVERDGPAVPDFDRMAADAGVPVDDKPVDDLAPDTAGLESEGGDGDADIPF